MKRDIFSFVIAIGIALAGCGGGGGGGGPSQLVVSGTVSAPNGQIAFSPKKSLLETFASIYSSPAYGSITGMAPVADGVTVELIRIDNSGNEIQVLATTTISGGQYTFNLTNLKVDLSGSLIAQVRNTGTGVRMRAFVTSGKADIHPVSEAAVRMVLEKVSGPPPGSLADFTNAEINDFNASIDLLTTASQTGAGLTIDATVQAVLSAAAADTSLMGFLDAAAGAGQTIEGPGDVGNFVPFGQGNVWRYRGTYSENGGPSTDYIGSVRITGTRDVGGNTETIFSENNLGNLGTVEDTYRVKSSQEILVTGNNDPTDTLTPALVPYREAIFPMAPGASLTQFDRKGLDFGEDLDMDGRNETIDLKSTVLAVDIENVAVPVGSFPVCMKIEINTTGTVRLSGSGTLVTIVVTQTRWFAPGVGLVKSITLTQGGGSTETATEELEGYFVDGKGKGVLPEMVVAAGVAPANSDVTVPGKAEVASDGNNFLVVYHRENGGIGTLSATLLSGTGSVIGTFDIGDDGAMPAAAFDGTNYLVIFGRNGSIFGNRVTPSGTVLDGQGFPISTGSSNFLPAVVFGGSEYLVAWGKFSGSEYDIYGARVTPSGNVLGEFPISQAVGEQNFPSVAFDGTNFLAVWNDNRNWPELEDIYGARVAADGTVLDPSGIPISTAAGPQVSPAIAFGGGHFLVVWGDGRNYSGGGPAKFDIFAARVDPDGTVLEGPAGIPVNTDPAPIEGKFNPSVTFDGANYFVTWQAGSFAIYIPSGIFTTRVSPAGALVDGLPAENGILISKPKDDFTRLYYPSLGTSGSNALLVWSNIAELSGTSKSISGVLVYP